MTVAAFTRYKLHDVPEALRLLAHEIETGEVSCVRCMVVLEPDGFGVDYRAFGAEPFTLAHAVGLLEWAKGNVIECSAPEGD